MGKTGLDGQELRVEGGVGGWEGRAWSGARGWPHTGGCGGPWEESTCAFSEMVGAEMMLKYFHGSPSTWWERWGDGWTAVRASGQVLVGSS